MTCFAAVDLGASSGRVMRATVSPRGVDLREVHRFPNQPVRIRGRLYWDVPALWSGILTGLRAAGEDGAPAGIGIDSWAVDYALLDADGELLGLPVHYRDARTSTVPPMVDELISPDELYAQTGIQRLPINTIYQFVAARETWAYRHAATAVMIPDLFGYWLTGAAQSEITNASTTGLLDVHTRRWAQEIATRVNIRTDLLPDPAEPGTLLATVAPDVAAQCGLSPGVPVWHVASHDTASAVLGIPAESDHFAYISCGTWAIVGVELPHPITSEAARAANFSNELGVDGTVRFVRNVMGLWLLQECLRTWGSVDLDVLLAEAADSLGQRSVINPDLPVFMAPGDMPARIQQECRRVGQPVPTTRAEITRCILDSLALAFRRTIDEAAALSGAAVDVIHLVGGGVRNTLLSQLTADACERPVVAGPVEAAARGNALIQARASGVLDGGLHELRRIGHQQTTRYLPHVRPTTSIRPGKEHRDVHARRP